MRLQLVVAGAVVVSVSAMSLAIARESPATPFAATAVGGVAMVGAACALATAGVMWIVGGRAGTVGPLLIAAAAAWPLGEWGTAGSGSDVTFTIGQVLFALCPAIVIWLALAYPLGALDAVAARVVVVGGFVVFVGLLGLAPALFFDPADAFCSRCPSNLVLLHADPAAAGRLSALGFRVAAATAVAAALMVAARLVRTGSTRQRPIAPVCVAAIAYLTAVSWSGLRSADRGFVGATDRDRHLWYVQAGALIALGLAVAWHRVTALRTRAALARLVIELTATTRPGELRRLLGRALHDDALELAYPVGDDRFADATGRPVVIPPTDSRVTTPIVRDGSVVAVLVHQPGRLAGGDVVDGVGAAARLGLDNEQLHAKLRVQERDLTASRARVISAADVERRRLERDLHDGAQQRLVGLLLALRLAQSDAAVAVPELGTELGDAITELQHAVDDLRRIAHGIHPAVLTDEGLGEALQALAEQGQFPVVVTGIPDERYPAAVEIAVYRVVAEAAKLGSVMVDAHRTDGALAVAVRARSEPDTIVDLRDRIGALDGRLDVERRRDDVWLLATIPCRAESCVPS